MSVVRTSKPDEISPQSSIPSISNATGPAARTLVDRPTAFDTPGVADVISERYRVDRILGSGGMGTVFEVTHKQLAKKFAAKIPHPRFSATETYRRGFFREARFVSSLSHRNVVTIVDYGEDARFGPFMVTEYLDGRPLSQALSNHGKFSLKRSCDLIQQLAEALVYVHKHNIVHLDIKTHNIFLCTETHGKHSRTLVKLLDFGLARPTRDGDRTGPAGTPAYIAPEVALGKPPTPAADVYAMGVLFFELLTGEPPWKVKTIESLEQYIHAPAPPLSSRAAKLDDPALGRLVARALEKDVRVRHPDMESFLYELQTVMHMLGLERRRRHVFVPDDERTQQIDKRRENARAAFDDFSIPIAIVNTSGMTLLCNAAFNRFLLGAGSNAEGTSILDSRLPLYWATIRDDLRHVTRRGSLARTIKVSTGEGERSLSIWLEAGVKRGQFTLSIHPVPTPEP